MIYRFSLTTCDRDAFTAVHAKALTSYSESASLNNTEAATLPEASLTRTLAVSEATALR